MFVNFAKVAHLDRKMLEEGLVKVSWCVLGELLRDSVLEGVQGLGS